MSIINFPESLSRQVAPGAMWGQRRNDVSFESVFGSQAVEVSAPRWVCELAVVPLRESEAGAWQAFLLSLNGGVNQLALWNIRRPAPLGTMRGSMVLNAAAAQGDKVLDITAGLGQAGKTLLAGDLLQVGSGATQQVVMVATSTTADGTGRIVIDFAQPLRNAFAGGAAVVWDRACALFRQTSGDGPKWAYADLMVRGFALSLLEDWRP
jgi:hypothetical protein